MRGKYLKTAWVIGLSVALFSCWLSPHFWYRGSLRPDNPPEGFAKEDLIGVWRADYKRYEWERCERPGEDETRKARSLVEWLVLKEDSTFYQVLRDRRGQIPDQWAQGTWWVERFPDGVTRLHLEKGRFFAEEVCASFPRLSPLPFAHGYVSDQTGHELSFNPQEKLEAIIIVGWDKFFKNLYLEYPYVCSDPDAPIIVEFERVPESEVNLVPTPVP